MSEPGYRVLWPLGKSTSKIAALKSRIDDLRGKTVCQLSHGGFRDPEIRPIVEEALAKQYPGIKFVAHSVFGNIHRPQGSAEVIAALPDKLLEHSCDAVITGIGSCGSCSPAVARASVVAEKAGFPTVTIVATAFVGQAKAIATAQGMPNLGIAEYPGIIMNHSKEQLRRNVEEVLVPNIIRELTSSVESTGILQEPEFEEIVFQGTLDEVNEFFLQKQWTDGLPIIPPTLERVGAFLRFTDRKPDQLIGVLAPENREATIWNIAVNGVMAGCRPEYMPVLIAIVEAMADPDFHIGDAGATPGWEPLIILNGPIVKELNFNYETAVLRAGRQANTSIGRFIRLYMRNVPGLRIAPGSTDKGSVGLGLNVVLAENEDAVNELGWESFSSERGFKRHENVVTVQSALSPTIPIYSAGEGALDHMETIVEVFGGTCAFWSHTAIRKGKYFPLLIVGPGVAKVIANDGWTKKDMQQHLFEHSKVSVKALQKHAWQIGFTAYDLHDLVKQGVVSDAYTQSHDIDRLVPAFIKPEWIGIVVSGDPGRNQSKGFVQNHDQAPPISKKIVLPAGWKELLGTAGSGNV